MSEPRVEAVTGAENRTQLLKRAVEFCAPVVLPKAPVKPQE